MRNWNYNNFFDDKTKKIQKVTLIKITENTSWLKKWAASFQAPIVIFKMGYIFCFLINYD